MCELQTTLNQIEDCNSRSCYRHSQCQASRFLTITDILTHFAVRTPSWAFPPSCFEPLRVSLSTDCYSYRIRQYLSQVPNLFFCTRFSTESKSHTIIIFYFLFYWHHIFCSHKNLYCSVSCPHSKTVFVLFVFFYFFLLDLWNKKFQIHATLPWMV